MLKRLFLVTVCLFAACPRPLTALGTRKQLTCSLHRVLRARDVGKPERNGNTITATSPHSSLLFTNGSRKLVFNDLLVLLSGPMSIDRRGRGWIAATDVTGVLDPLLCRSSLLQQLPEYPRLLLDPGHGGTDTGAVGAGPVNEKDITLNIARLVRDRLRAGGFTVRLTRDSDLFIPLSDRTRMAAEWRADLFVSIHLNASHNPIASGLETYIVPAAGFPSTANQANDNHSCQGNRHDPVNMLLAYSVHAEILRRTHQADRGIRRARYVVLRDAPCPAILVECGFLSNKQEAKTLATPTRQNTFADGITAGIRALRGVGVRR